MTSSLYDAPRLYDLMSPMLTEGEAELAWWREVAREAGAEAGGVLELGAGTGRVAIPLARGGLSVTAVDRSPSMLARGRERAATAGVTIEWIDAEMTRLALGRRFAAVLLPYNTLLHLHTRIEHEALFAAVARHLTPDGRFGFSVVNPDLPTLARRRDHRLAITAPVYDPVAGAPLSVEETIDYDHAGQRTRGVFHFSYPGRPDFLHTEVDLRMLFPAELEALVHLLGFELVARHGDWQGGAFTSASPVQNVICRPRRA